MKRVDEIKRYENLYKAKREEIEGTVFLFIDKNNFLLLEWVPKKSKPYTYRFSTAKERRDYFNKEKKKIVRRKKANDEALKNLDSWKNKILYTSWGYEQTNIDYYKIVKVEKGFLYLRELAKICDQTGWLTGNVVPNKRKFKGNVIKKKASFWNGEISLKLDDYRHLNEWNNKPLAYSKYA